LRGGLFRGHDLVAFQRRLPSRRTQRSALLASTIGAQQLTIWMHRVEDLYRGD
jgi:hypothetical protein